MRLSTLPRLRRLRSGTLAVVRLRWARRDAYARWAADGSLVALVATAPPAQAPPAGQAPPSDDDDRPVSTDDVPVPPPPPAERTPADQQLPPPDNGIPFTIPIGFLEGWETSDDRFFVAGGFGRRDLPMTLMCMVRNPDGGWGHDAAIILGRIDTLDRFDASAELNRETGQPFGPGVWGWKATGWLTPDENVPETVAAVGYVKDGTLRGVSADVGECISEIEVEAIDDEGWPTEFREVVTQGVIAGLTVCPCAAFPGATIVLGGETLDAGTGGAPAAPEAPSGDQGGQAAARRHTLAPGDTPAPPAEDAATGCPDGCNADGCDPNGAAGSCPGCDDTCPSCVTGCGGCSDSCTPPAGQTASVRPARLARPGQPGVVRISSDSDCAPCRAGRPILASGGPEAPPRAWFYREEPEELTPWTVLESGEAFGHLAPWDTCHTGVGNACITAPRGGEDGYGLFHTGAVLTAEGQQVPVGHITLGGGHADVRLGIAPAIRHYDDAGAAVADVRAVDGQHGIWLSGAVRPEATETQVRQLRAHALSGDWRADARGGPLRLVAALCVNVPGFPVPRARVASGQQAALVAAGAQAVEVIRRRNASGAPDAVVAAAVRRALAPILRRQAREELRRVIRAR